MAAAAVVGVTVVTWPFWVVTTGTTEVAMVVGTGRVVTTVTGAQPPAVHVVVVHVVVTTEAVVLLQEGFMHW